MNERETIASIIEASRSDEARLKKAHKEWRKSLEDIFVRRSEQISGKKFSGILSRIGDDEMMRMLDNMGWGPRPTDKAK